ncbi:MAG: hypothetical protein WD184_01640 [Acidimicrobiia bacterium]
MGLIFLFDVDNTLLDHDALKVTLGDALLASLDGTDVALFWELYEQVRRDLGLVSLPETVERFLPTHCEDPLAPQKLAEVLFHLDLGSCLRPGAVELLRKASEFGTTVILSNGDQFFQRWKIWQSGLAEAVGGRVWVFPDKVDHFEDLDSRFGMDSRFVLVEDKADALAAAQAHWRHRVTTVLVAFGHHAASDTSGVEVDMIVGSPAELLARFGEMLPSGWGDHSSAP